tara:strand:+ start:6302 stop:7042 length:741 start_codon:yes stop_codon:yes gene_type:complete
MDFTALLLMLTLACGVSFILHRSFNFSDKTSYLLDFLASLFPILFIVLFIRSFVFEPFRIPSGSMIPTLLVGDFILVNKYKYGLRLPLTNKLIFENKYPRRGDVVVFQFPENTKINYIKRVVGIPGDRVEYINKTLFINGIQLSLQKFNDQDSSNTNLSNQMIYIENNGNKEYLILNSTNRGIDFGFNVPDDNYFVLGDNRDNSNDSRYWGTVHKNNLIGEAFMIWMYWNPQSETKIFDRVGKDIE